MTNLVDQPYYEWLISQIEFPRTLRKSFDDVLLRLHETEFIWMISGDDNRAQDARDLRVEFKHQYSGRMKFKEFVSVLEVMVAISRILEFVAGGKAPQWAWRLIDNLGLDHYPDPLNGTKTAKLDEILESLVWRTYEKNGRGGFFPLVFPREDQTKVEIWYQLNAYVREIIES